MRQWMMNLGSCAIAAQLGLSTGSVAHAAPESTVEPQPDAIVIAVIVDEQADRGLIDALDAARAHLATQGVDLRAVPRRPDEPAATRARAVVQHEGGRGAFWFDARDPEELRVFLVASDGAAYVRRLPVGDDSAEANREAVWLIVESAGLALAAGEEVAMEEASTEELEPPPPVEPDPVEPQPKPTQPEPTQLEPTQPEPEPEPRLRGGLVLAYLGEGLAADVPWQSGVGLGGVLDLGRRLRLSIDYGLLVPWRSGAPPLTWRHRGELRAGPRFDVGSRLTLSVLAGAGVEALRWRETDGGDGGWRMVASAGLDAGLGIRLWSRLSVVIEPGLGVVLNRFEFVECAAGSDCTGSDRRTVLDPWRLRPRARFGLRVDL